MSDWYQTPKELILKQMQVPEGGLSSHAAETIRAQVGENTLTEQARKKAWQVFLAQFQDLLVVILIIAAIISMVSGNAESTVVIFAVIILNAILGTAQHQKAQKSLDSLKALSAPCAKILRDGRITEIPSSQVVPGDIMLLEAGDLAVADGRLLECHSLMVNESSLTGESDHVEKQTSALSGSQLPPADQTNMVFSGSLITGGRGKAVVTATGMQTEIGKIAAIMNATEEKKTPLQISLDKFSSHLAAGIMLICALVFVLGLLRGTPILESLMFAVALAVAAIPEALGSIVTIVQAMGTQRMAREHAIIKDLKAVESLGCVSVICSDKTGTLTQNRMSVQEIYTDNRLIPPFQLNPCHPVHRYLLYAAVLTNDAAIEEARTPKTDAASPRRWLGDPTEAALLEMGERAHVDIPWLRREFPRLGELPFDSGRKMMSTLHRIHDKRILFTKGALDVLLERSESILTTAGVRPLTGAWRQQIISQNQDWSSHGLRVLAMAYREIPETQELSPETEQNYIFLGMSAMMDPPRMESRTAVLSARRAGIRPVMITGDHKITASAIARRIGLFQEGDLAVTGVELDAMEEEELQQSLKRISVYARVSPEHKIRIVNAWQSRGNIVAMTGDGVNDAPALKKADIGIAMGITGTEVSKDAASMILTDDNFATIIRAVANGRNVYRNIRHAIQFLLSGNMAGIFSVLYTSLLALPMPFAPVHLLFINLLTDSLPAIAIGMEPQEEGLLDQPPRAPGEGILTRQFLASILLQGGLIAIGTMAAFHVGMETGGAGTASTMAFATLTLARLFHGFNCRSEHSILRLGLSGNLWSVMAFEAGAVLLAAVLFFPGLQVLFAVADLSLRQLMTIVIFALLPTAFIQASKTLKEALR
ncbi:cation-translocating P-type ATPase [Clostridiaceae bacterium]|nr:cation-translocating P-type ATPase [Clostridiaceae bacterium]RKI17521.1 cation-translocating P-type ATPase [bacterium 1XD21-70]